LAEPQSFDIVKASWQDLNDLRKLEDICFGEDSWPLWDLIAVLTLPKIIRMKAVVGDRMAGFVAGDPQPREGIGWIATLGVLPEFRRQGIAAALLSICEQLLALPRIRLSVRRSNESAIKLYRSAGYEMIDIWRAYYNSGEDALVFEKQIHQTQSQKGVDNPQDSIYTLGTGE
jgi:ribosomal-protein-alanine N-acetyltransferase